MKLILIIFCFLTLACNKTKETKISNTDELEIKTTTNSNKEDSLFNKKTNQTLKFKQNRESKEQQRVFELLIESIENGSLKMDPKGLEYILNGLKTSNPNDSINIKKLESLLKKLDSTYK